MSGRAPPTGPRALRTYVTPNSNQILPSESGAELPSGPRSLVNGSTSYRSLHPNGLSLTPTHSSTPSTFSRPPPSGPKATSKLTTPGPWQHPRPTSTSHPSSSSVLQESLTQRHQSYNKTGIESTGRAPISFTLPRASQPPPPPPGPEQRPPSPTASPPPPPPPPPADDIPPPPPPDTPPPAPSELPHLKTPIKFPPTLPQEPRTAPPPFPEPKKLEESPPAPPSVEPPPLPPPDLPRPIPKPPIPLLHDRSQQNPFVPASIPPFKPPPPPPAPVPIKEPIPTPPPLPPPPRPPTPLPNGVSMSYEKVPGKDSLQKLYSLNPPPAWPPSRSEFPSGRDFRVIFDSHYEPDREKDRYGSMRMLASRLREKGLNDRILEGKDKDKEKGKGKLIIYRFDGETIEGEDEARPADPRKASGSGSRRSRLRNEFYLTSYEHDANSCGPSPATNILIFGFPPLTTNGAIRTHFMKYGNITSLDRELDHATGAALDVVSVQYSTHAEAARAVSGEEGKNFTNNVIGFGAAAVSLSSKQNGKGGVKVMFDGEGKLLKLLLNLYAEKRKKDKEPKPPPPPPPIVDPSGSGLSSTSGNLKSSTSMNGPPPSWRSGGQPFQSGPQSRPFPHASLPSRPPVPLNFNNYSSNHAGRGKEGFYRGTGAPRRGLPSALFRARSVNSVQATMIDGSPSVDSGGHGSESLNDHTSDREFRMTRVGRSPSPTRISSPRHRPSPRRPPSPRHYHSPKRSLSPRRRVSSPRRPPSPIGARSRSPIRARPSSPVHARPPSPIPTQSPPQPPARLPSPPPPPLSPPPRPPTPVSQPSPKRPPSPERPPSPKRAPSTPPPDEPPSKRTKLEKEQTEVVENVVPILEINGVVPEPVEPQTKNKKTTKKADKEKKERRSTKQAKRAKNEQTVVDTIIITPPMDIDVPVVTEVRILPTSELTIAIPSVEPSESAPVPDEPKGPLKLVDPLAESDLLEVAGDDEDLYFARLALSMDVEASNFKVPDTKAPPPAPTSPPPLRKHTTGSARTEGSYKIPHTEKSAYVAQYAMRGATTSSTIPKEVPTQQPNVSSRSNRANARRRAQGLDELNQLQLAVALSKGETAVTGDTVKFNQLQTRKKHLRFARSPIHDWGLYALERIGRGEMVIEYVGEIIRAAVADKREKVYERQGIGSSYLFRIDEDLVVDATKKGNLGRLINHSCDPNCTAKIITINGEKKIVIYAKEDIELGDEITYDYHFPIEQDKIPCLCGSAKCRGYLN